MKSKIARGSTAHQRFLPSSHKFTYPITYYGFDLDELEKINKLPLFGVNRFNLRSLNVRDYGTWSNIGDIKEDILGRCGKKDAEFTAGKVLLYTMPRILGYVFNPVSFYLVYNLQNELSFLVLEINNTYSEKHQYILSIKEAKNAGVAYSWNFPKEFYVSPFWDMEYNYQVTLITTSERLRVDVNLYQKQELVFASDVDLKLTELNSKNHLLDCITSPIRMAMTMPRILFQALILFVYRRISVKPKPNPTHLNTIRAKTYTWTDSFAMWFVMRSLKNIQNGSIIIEYPDGRIQEFGNASTGLSAKLKLNNYKMFRKILLTGSIGFSEAFCEGDWESEEPAHVLSFFLNNYHAIKEQKLNLFKPFRKLELLWHWLRRNTKINSRRNISAHYDLSNEFFSLFLDEKKVYSAGFYPSSQATLEQAQLAKLDKVMQKARLKNSQSILEIGSGWGALAESCAEKYGCSVVSLTLSEEQKKLAEQSAKAKGLNSKVEYRLQDYREVSGSFDRIVSVEMLEAVGHENLGNFFKACNRVLNPEGLLVVQVISYPDNEYDFYRGRSDWIQKHIFPGSHLPSLGALVGAAGKHGFVVENLENLAEHYALTLKEWRIRFDARIKEVKSLGFDDSFIRKWRYYLAACEAQFATRWLAVYQIVFTRPNNSLLQIDQEIYRWEKAA